MEYVNDPEEKESVSAKFLSKVNKVKAILDEHRKIAEKMKVSFDIMDVEKIELEEETMCMLRSLGHIK